MLALLLRRHANANACTTFEQLTPLHVAVKHKHKDAALQLIDTGADVTLVDAVRKSERMLSRSLLPFTV
jgi:hypothetical protein